ncbi:MAG TPA: outer membrane beta-barrel protein [Chitinophagaceae bacterium]
MKKTINLILAVLLAGHAIGQQLPATDSRATIKWAPTGLVYGGLNFGGEYNVGEKRSVTARIGLPVTVQNTVEYDGKHVDFNMKATSLSAGYRVYLSKKHMRGLYVEPYAKYVHHSSEGVGTGNLEDKMAVMDFTNEYKAVGVGAQLGAQFFLGKRFVVDLYFIGPEINSATDHLKAVEVSNELPWTAIEAEDAENTIRAFVDRYPFVRNRTDIKVDRNNRTVTADFKGALPGYRAGLSLGFAL